VRLETPLTRSETQDYVRARLARSGAPRSLADRFDSATIARLQRESGGNPLRLHGLAVAVARGAPPVAAPRAAVWSGPAPIVEERPPAALVTSLRPERVPAAPAPVLRAEAEPERTAEPAPRPRKRSRGGLTALIGPAWAVAGLCVGLGLSLVLAEWRQREPAPAQPAAEPVAERRAAREEPVEIPVLPPPAALGAQSLERAAPSVSAPPPRPAEAAPAPAAESPGRAAEASPPAASSAPPAAASAQPAASPGEAGSERGGAGEPPPAAPAPSAPSPAGQELSAHAPAPAAPAPPVRRPEPAPLAAARLDVHSDTPVEIEIDGRPFGSPPLVGVRLPRGEHRVIARYPDGSAGLKTIYLGEDNVSLTFR
jgi:hypothetical protein